MAERQLMDAMQDMIDKTLDDVFERADRRLALVDAGAAPKSEKVDEPLPQKPFRSGQGPPASEPQPASATRRNTPPDFDAMQQLIDQHLRKIEK